MFDLVSLLEFGAAAELLDVRNHDATLAVAETE